MFRLAPKVFDAQRPKATLVVDINLGERLAALLYLQRHAPSSTKSDRNADTARPIERWALFG
jgi:hypothetical protein